MLFHRQRIHEKEVCGVNLMADVICLSDLTLGEVKNLAGHDRGLKARQHFGVDGLDGSASVVTVKIPEDFRAISPSFFQGMFAKSVHQLGLSRFFEHYRFDAPAHIRSKLVEYARQSEARNTTRH